MVNSTKLVTIKCGKDTADVSVCPEDFHLAELESWVRGRFQFSSNDRILYKDGDGNECLPSKSFLLSNKMLSVEVVAAPKPAARKPVDKSALIQFHIPIAVAAIAVLVYIFQHTGLVPFASSVETTLSSSGYYLKKEVMLEAMVNGLGWALMHLFVRRMLNPENEGKWFDGYFLDSCYGGLAAFGQTLFKGYFLGNILRRAAAT